MTREGAWEENVCPGEYRVERAACAPELHPIYIDAKFSSASATIPAILATEPQRPSSLRTISTARISQRLRFGTTPAAAPAYVQGDDYEIVAVTANTVEVDWLSGTPAASENARDHYRRGRRSLFSGPTPTRLPKSMGSKACSTASRLASRFSRGVSSGSVPTATASERASAHWELPKIFEVFPARAAVTAPAEGGGLGDLNLAGVPRRGGLLPAVHDATVEALPLPIPAAASVYTGRVFQNQSGAEVLLSGGGRGGRGVHATKQRIRRLRRPILVSCRPS